MMKPVKKLLPGMLVLFAVMLGLCCMPSTVHAGAVTGQVMINKTKPMTKGVVLFYSKYSGPPPSPYKYWRIPDMVFPADSKGKFSATLAAGDWYMMVAQKKLTTEIGPPLESEYLYFHGDAEGNAKVITVMEEGTVDLGKLTGTFNWLPSMSERDKGTTYMAGVVRNPEGKPVKNLVVLAFYTPEARRRPAFVSERTDNDGRFLIRVAEGGDYWLKVRGVFGGGAPASGEFQNTTNDFEPVMVSLKTGEQLKGIVLNVKEFSGVGSTGKPAPERVWQRVNDMNPEPQQPSPPAKNKKSGR